MVGVPMMTNYHVISPTLRGAAAEQTSDWRGNAVFCETAEDDGFISTISLQDKSPEEIIRCLLHVEPTHKLLLAAGADCILELAAMFCAQ